LEGAAVGALARTADGAFDIEALFL
jgi:hypothetical protein